ncbi:MAG: DUF2490 domain-containing protein [Gracilimonas sp.]|uniref:DUF2490 domain-containing protein n=1 Tax=Gracilimonas sp. TaxID=1974203 RepID=UPI00198ECE0D|nr:DUF2490 domain-containing protein [Gracilimonas sp.]MBD3615559.1 DUF2490 domain-containing protein [Gracilimonas sp.]
MNFLKIGLLFVVTGIFTSTALAQEADLIWSPELSYSWKQSDRLGFTAKVSMFNSLRDLDNKSAVQYIEPTLTFSYSTSPRVKLGGGYYYRNSTPFLPGYQYEHRFLEQIGFISFIGDKRIAHRLRAEQRVRSSSYQNRIRYRISYDFPLEGEKLDAGEKYFIVKNEMMSAFNKDAADAENRADIGLGWYFNEKQKFELGLQYRTQDIFSDSGISHLILIRTSYYMNR